jgi:hypothetical protein
MNGPSVLTKEDISDVLKRADEISAEASALVPSDPSLAAFAQAAEEAGTALTSFGSLIAGAALTYLLTR